MRGTPRARAPPLRERRFIPAYAGNAMEVLRRYLMKTVHPRVCGERVVVVAHLGNLLGSSPRMRGTPRPPSDPRGSVRFIPAYAGNATAPMTGKPAKSVHPRVCGERRVRPFPHILRDGSSPRMRGTPASCRRKSASKRFIPAYAGNASRRRRSGPPTPVHPRVCGERSPVCGRTRSAPGSSPRMRGTPPALDPEAGVDRFIPAYAGNAAHAVTSRAMTAVHPRVCGERARRRVRTNACCGSSPRMRGTQLMQ